MFDRKEKPENKEQNNVNAQAPITPVMDINSFMDYIQKATKEKSHIDAVLELTNPEHLDFITEWPTVAYTKMATKLMTWRATIAEVGNLDTGVRYEGNPARAVYHPELDETDTIVREMVQQFMLKMVSHKRRRAQEIVSALRNNPNENIYMMENKVKKSFFGLR
jgi:hypothetical protein